MSRFSLTVACLLNLFVLPVQSAPRLEQVSVEQCPLPAQTLTLISSATELKRLKLTPLPLSRMPDWRRERLIFIPAGQRPTPGYRLSLGSSRIVANTLELHIAEQGPLPDAFLPQVITQPCLILRLEKSGWHKVKVFDRLGRTVLSHPLP